MNFRWIRGEELERLRPVMDARGWTPLDPVFAKALIAENEAGEIVAFNVLQVVLRPEPMWVAAGYRGEENGNLAMRLASEMTEFLKQSGADYWEIRAENPFVERLCMAHQMKPVEAPMYAYGGRP